MFHHVVMVAFKAALDPADHAYLVRACEEIERQLPGVIRLRFVTNLADRAGPYTHAFVGDFVDAAAHDHYQAAPLHGPLKARVNALCQALLVLDCND